MPALTPENTGGAFKSIWGRFFGLLGDDLGHRHLYVGGPNGKIVASTRLPIFVGIVGLNGAGAVTLTGANVGDLVAGVASATDGTDLSASFETTISVAGQVQQSSASDLSSKKLTILVYRQS